MRGLLVVTALLASSALLSGCGAGPQPTAQDLTACGTVNSMFASEFVTTPLSQQEALAAQLVQQAKASNSASLLTGAEELAAAARAESGPRVTAVLKRLGATCTAMGIGPSNGGI